MLTRGVFKPTKNDHFQELLIVWVSSPRFGQVNERLILQLCGMIRVLPVFSCPTNFNLVCDQDRQSGVLNPTQNDQF